MFKDYLALGRLDANHEGPEIVSSDFRVEALDAAPLRPRKSLLLAPLFYTHVDKNRGHLGRITVAMS